MQNFAASSSLPQSNIEVEEALLGSILIDPRAIYQVAETLPVEAFYIDAHRDIYQACLKLYKQQQHIDLLTVTTWLTDNNLLARIGGRNKLAMLVDRCVTSINIDYYADILIEKYVRRQVQTLGYYLDQAAHDTEKPLSWNLEQIESKVLSITQLRNAKGKGYWQKIDDIAFERLCKELDEIEAIENAAQRDWLMKKLAKKWQFSNKKELLDFHAKWLDSKSKVKTYTTKEYFEKYGMSEQDWLIPGFVPAESVIVLYADGGVGKTRLAFSLAKSAVTGGTFAYEGTEFSPMNTLLIETDQGPRITSKLLEMQELIDGEQCQRLHICDEWTVGEFGKLKAMLKENQPKLVIIDSLTSISVDSFYSENETEYARPLVRLRHLAKEFGCTFLMVHHSNASGDMRGSRAIRNTVDEVWKFTKQQNEIGQFNVLTIDKTRSRAPGSYKFTYDDESWGWQFKGRLEDDVIGSNAASTNAMTACIRFLTAKAGIPFEAQEVAQSVGISENTARKELRRASSEGLVNVGRSIRNRKALVYYVGSRELLSNITSDPSDPSDPEQRITSYASQGMDYSPSDPSDPSNSKKISESEIKMADHLDHLDHLSLKAIPEEESQVIRSSDPPTDQNGSDYEKVKEFSEDVTHCKPTEIAEGGIYWSRTLKKQVKIVKIYSSVRKADVAVAGDPTEKPRLAFSDLLISEPPLAPGERVEVLAGGKHKGQVLLVSSVHQGEYWLKGEGKGLNKPVGGFTPDQLRRV